MASPPSAGLFMKGNVVALHLCPGSRQPMRSVSEAIAVSDLGLEGDRHAKQGSRRQLLLMDEKILKAFELPNGAVRENITLSGFPLMALVAGTRFAIGEQAIFEITGECEPCSRMDEIRPGLQSKLQGQRGMVARVVAGGTIKVGDVVRVGDI